jgi:hypothetical protein
MATVTIVKHKRAEDFQTDFLKWVRDNDLTKKYGIKHEEIPELFQILLKFSSEVDMVKSINQSSYFITNDGLHHVASKIMEEFIREDTHYVIVDSLDMSGDDHMLVILT